MIIEGQKNRPEFLPPCVTHQTLCQKEAAKSIKTDPCWLQTQSECPPSNAHIARMEQGIPEKISEADMMIDVHHTCPFTSQSLYSGNGSEKLMGTRGLILAIKSGQIENENNYRFPQLVIHDLKNGLLPQPLISPSKGNKI
jgi:hypothetical protein